MTTFAFRFDASCAARWPDNTVAAAAIREGLACAGLGRTNRVQISRWRNGLTVPNLAVQNAIVAWLHEQRESERGAVAAPPQRTVFRRSSPRSKGGDLV